MDIPSDGVDLSASLADLLEARSAAPHLSDERRTLLRREFMAQIRKASPPEDGRDTGTT